MLYKTLSAAVYGIDASIIEVEVDISGLTAVDQQITVADLRLPPGVTVDTDPETVVVQIVASSLDALDVTARKVHQWSMVALVVLGFLLGGMNPVAGAVPLVIAGLVMLVGRFWWPADVVRQLTWRVLEPAGIVKRRHVHEDHQTRRVARVIGGSAWLLSAVLLVAGVPVAAWIIAFAIAVMVALDAAANFCVLCFAVAWARR